jgi:hypothetical protein
LPVIDKSERKNKMLFALITAWLAYKRAQATGRSAILWAFVGAAVFITTQMLVSLGCGILLDSAWNCSASLKTFTIIRQFR